MKLTLNPPQREGHCDAVKLVKRSKPVSSAPVISAESLVAVKAGREKLDRLAKQMKEIENAIVPIERDIIVALEAGGTLEPGGPLALVTTKERRIAAWKQEFIKANGQAAADAVITRTIPTVTKQLVIQ